MALSTPVRLWRVAPMVAVAALGLVACSANQDPTDAVGTTPPPFTSSAAPNEGEHGTGHGGESTSEGSAGEDSLTANLRNQQGQTVGTVTFTDEGGYLSVEAEVSNVTPGFHGFHIHQGTTCEGNFDSAGGHLTLPGNTAGHANGDLTSIQVREDGAAELTTTTDMVTLNDIDGRALIIHEGPDNFANIPADRYTNSEGGQGADERTRMTGDAGGRFACGTIG